jgi:hypothetical protein
MDWDFFSCPAGAKSWPELLHIVPGIILRTGTYYLCTTTAGGKRKRGYHRFSLFGQYLLHSINSTFRVEHNLQSLQQHER